MSMILPDETALGQRPSPKPAQQIADFTPPNWRLAGAAGQELSGAGQALQQAGQIVANTNTQYDAIAADNALNSLQQQRATLEFDPQVGYTQAKGANAVGQEFLQNYQGKFQNAISEISDGLANNQQKQMFAQRANMAGAQFNAGLMAHQAQQTTVYANDTDDASVKNALNDIASHPYDENTFQTSMQIANNALSSKASRSGYSAPVIDNARASLNSAALASRTSGMMQDNPTQAADFFHQHELEFDPNTRLRLSGELKTTTDAQTSRMDGQTAYQQGIGTPPASGAPIAKDLGAPTVPAYLPDQIQNIVKQVQAPSQYDALFQKYGQMYNVSPTELKLRAVAESGLKSDATSSQGAQGLMQITPDTAARLGIDATKPEQAIMGAAKLMSQAGGTFGSDMTAVDRTYYGGNATAKGPNTDQYVENLRAVRATLYGQAAAPTTAAGLEGAEGSVVDQAKAVASQRRPGDLVYQDQVVAEARKNWAQNLSAIKGQDYANYSGLLQQSIGPAGAKGLSDLSAADQTTFSHLPPDNQHSLLNLWKSNNVLEDKIAPTPATDNKSLALMGQAINDPVAFKNLDIVAATQDLPRQNQQQIYSAWLGIDKNMAQGANVQKALTVMRPDMEIAKIKFPDKAEKGSTASFDDYNAYTKLLNDGVSNFQDQNKRAPTTQEIQAIGRPLLSQVQINGGSWFGFANKDIKAFQASTDKNSPNYEANVVVPMQPAEVQTITNKLSQRYGYAPSQSQVQAFKTMSILHPNDPNVLRQFDQTMRSSAPKGQQ